MVPYALADISVPDGTRLISLSQNESHRPPAPEVLEAARSSFSNAVLYPDPDWTALRQALAGRYRIDPDLILCGAGSLDLIAAIARVYAGPDRAILAPAHAYPFFRTSAQMADARFDTAFETPEAVSIDALLAAARPDTSVVFLANPGNPTGTRLPRSEIARLRENLPDTALLVIDEAYGEFADHLGEPCFGLVANGPTVVLRTFSKAYGMAGYRVGWGLFPKKIATEIRKVLNPNNLPAASQAAATAAVEAHAYMRDTCVLTAEIRDHARTQLQTAGFHVRESLTNFLLLDLASAIEAQHAETWLRRQGILLRRQSGVGLPHALRITIGPEPDMAQAVNALTNWTQESRS